MKALWLALILAFGSDDAFAARKRSGLTREIRAARLEAYEKAGRAVALSLRRNMIALSNSMGEGELAEKLLSVYEEKIRPGALEPISAEPRRRRTGAFVEDVRRALTLRHGHAKTFRVNPEVRRRIQHVFIGLLHVLDVEIRAELDASVDELARVRRYLLTQGTFVTRGAGKLNVDDLWWDWLWLRGHGFAPDLVELHLQKVQAISRGAQARWRERLRLHAVSTSLFALRRATPPALGRDKPAVVQVRLANAALDLAGPTAPAAISKELKVQLFRGLQANGQTFEANQLKKEIATDVFLAKGWQIVETPARAWSRKDLGLVERASSSAAGFVRSVFGFLTYGAGFLFVATPIEVLLILLSLAVLCKQGERHFNVEVRGLRRIWTDHRLLERGGWKRAPSLARESARYAAEELGIAWRMFVASYTSSQVPFYSKVAASMLLFGVGLYFNSARAMVDTFVSQM